MTSDSKTETLRDYPDIAIEIACFIASVSILESKLHLLTAQIIGDQTGFTHAFLAPSHNLLQKLTIMVEIAKTVQDKPQSKALLSAEGDINTAVQFRNLLAHSLHSIEDGKVHAISYLVAKKDPRLTPLTADEFERQNAILTTAHQKVNSGLKHGVQASYVRSMRTSAPVKP